MDMMTGMLSAMNLLNNKERRVTYFLGGFYLYRKP